jgi:hypothetical protein
MIKPVIFLHIRKTHKLKNTSQGDMDNHSMNRRLENWNNGIVEGWLEKKKTIFQRSIIPSG